MLARRAESLANVRSEVELGIRFPSFWLHRAIEPGNIFARMDRSEGKKHRVYSLRNLVDPQDSLFDRDLLIDRNHMSECVCENPGCS